MVASRVRTVVLTFALVATWCSSSWAINPTTGAFTFEVFPVYRPSGDPNGTLIGYTYVLDPNLVTEFIGDIEYNLDGRRLQFTRGATLSTDNGTENLHGMQDFIISPNFTEDQDFIKNVHGTNPTNPEGQSGDMFRVTFDLITLDDPGPAPRIRFFGSPPAQFITMDGQNVSPFDIMSVPEPTACSLLLLGTVCLGLTFWREKRGLRAGHG